MPIGAVVVRDGEVVAAAGNERELRADPTAHAEILALRAAAAALGGWRIPDSILYVTLEPCAMCAGRDRPRADPARRLSAPPTRRPAPPAACSTSSPSRGSTTGPQVNAACSASESAALLRAFFAERRG